jgi:hypothetical protein
MEWFQHQDDWKIFLPGALLAAHVAAKVQHLSKGHSH